MGSASCLPDRATKEARIRPTFDISTVSPNGRPLRIESVQRLEDAKERLREVARTVPRRNCFIYSQESSVVEIIIRSDLRESPIALCSAHGHTAREAS
jgi:hypothetical protein